MHDFVLVGLVLTVILLLVILLVADDGLQMTVPGLVAHFLWFEQRMAFEFVSFS